MTEESPDIETPKADAVAEPETAGAPVEAVAVPAPPVEPVADMPLLRIEGVGKTFGGFRAV